MGSINTINAFSVDCAYITRMNSPEFLERSAMDGAFFETWVVSEIYKSYLNSGVRPPLYFYRDQNRKEVDHVGGLAFPSDL